MRSSAGKVRDSLWAPVNLVLTCVAAVQSVGRQDDGYIAYWSESHVSEDFDIALRLQIAGNVVRLAAYHNDEFKEGVSLTIYDELQRWEKYAFSQPVPLLPKMLTAPGS